MFGIGHWELLLISPLILAGIILWWVNRTSSARRCRICGAPLEKNAAVCAHCHYLQ